MIIASDWRLLLGSSHFGKRSAPSTNSKKGTKNCNSKRSPPRTLGVHSNDSNTQAADSAGQDLAIGGSLGRINTASSRCKFPSRIRNLHITSMDTFITISAPATVNIPADQEDPGGSGGQAYCVVSQAPVDVPADQEDPGGSGGQAYCVIA